MIRYTLLVLLLCMVYTSNAQPDQERSVQVYAEWDAFENALVLSWKARAEATSYRISRWEGNTWIRMATVDTPMTSYILADHGIGESREYRIEKIGGTIGYGYITVAHRLPYKWSTKQCLLLVDSLLFEPLDTELEIWQNDVESEGWNVNLATTSSNESVQDVKAKIEEWHSKSPGDQHAVFILGNIAVPYSGNINPDGHGDHKGAWPCDGFYGDLNSELWSDNSVNEVSASDARNHNIPGDGRFDQSILPSSLELQIGRVDLFDLPAFGEDYIELTRNYLDKNHAFRQAHFEVQRRAIVENNFGSYAEGFAQNGWKNFSTMFGPENVRYGDYENELEQDDFLWAYACGGGSYTSMGGVGNTTNLYVERDLKAIFVMNFGSYFGDWDRRNNLMRASLCSGTILANAWAGRPNWQFHRMALGANIGSCAQATQNNINQYTPGYGGRFAHVSLLGDPTLMMHPVVPPTNLILKEENQTIKLSWTASKDAEVGYFILKKLGNGNLQLLTREPIMDTSFVDPCIQSDISHTYYVKSVKWESSASGSYMNAGAGISEIIFPTETTMLAEPNFTFNTNFEQVSLQTAVSGYDSLRWQLSDGTIYRDTNQLTHLFEEAGQWEICLTLFSPCGETTKCDTVNLESSLPQTYTIDTTHVLCHGDSSGAIAFVHSGGLSLNYQWSNGSMDSTLTELPAGSYDVEITSVVGRKLFIVGITITEPSEIKVNVVTTPSTGTDGTAELEIEGGVKPYDIKWDDGSVDPNQLPPGTYFVTVTDDNGCTVVVDFEIKMTTSSGEERKNNVEAFPNPTYNRQFILEGWSDPMVLESITNVEGKNVAFKSQRIDNSRLSVVINIEVSGVVYLSLRNGEDVIILPLMVQNMR